MTKAAERLGPRELIATLAMYQRHETSVDALHNFWRLRLELLAEALGLPEGWEHARQTPLMLRTLARETIRDDVFGDFLEYTYVPGEQEAIAQHRPRIAKALDTFRRRYEDLAVALLLLGWPHLRRRRASIEIWRERGLDIAPDPIDYF